MAGHSTDEYYDHSDYVPNPNEEPDAEQQALLPGPTTQLSPSHPTWTSKLFTSTLHVYSYLTLSFLAGILACLAAQFFFCSSNCFSSFTPSNRKSDAHVLAPPYVGSTEVHHFPPALPTNAFPSLFPTNVGYAGGTPTGAEPAVVATAPSYPIHSGAPHLVAPSSKKLSNSSSSSGFDLFKKWGNLSPWYSVGRDAFGLDSGPEPPETCRITGLHFLHRHGARYPTSWTSYGGPAFFAKRLNDAAAGWNATGDLEFMNKWTYKLGEEILTPFGRQQLFDLGVSIRMKYGFLLKNFTETNTIPVFRTESQDRMLASALNFAIGFFGYPFEGQYQQSITIEANGFNNTLAPYKTCPNAQIPSKSDRALPYLRQWANTYLADALERLKPQLVGYDLTTEDVYTLQQMCAYETVAIGYSKFCELFTEEEWEGFNYAMDLYFWYDSAFGSPVAKVQGVGYVQELVARLTHTPIAVHNSSTNATLDDDPVTFPLNQSLYVDATHEVVVLNVITALNLTSFAKDGPLPATHIPPNRSFVVSRLAPFATNVQFQLLSCSSTPNSQIRVIINDGVVPLTGIKGCPEQKDGMCSVDTFVEAQREIIAETDWEWGCHGEWTVPEGSGWNTTTGEPPRRV
ncbi:phosphoglycerate mutase-like protein [Neolentinus lepideus HHB14362 ss-1]|uniref:Phosphoglycerate mutase-like protein n=1 Tax=Neolentinus lepideus HHB14362 ss-1 TaxID=1314782 RepID=A0A165QUC7_9AGAM|nr:phosphoglycerate mutase-like protein [Neolentinus lepideus HHB14362 ss-1]